ncbi:hypothetical protein [Bacillus cereus group sp. MYBK134-1]|uniref:hypothetical protein n=1 Tax=unclassified Bacillus cereus group TaxID=2750818 RepID=UPI003F79507F
MSVTTFIAISGLTLGVINTGTTIYNVFFKKDPTPSLDVYYDNASWRYFPHNDKTQCQIHIDLTVIARNSTNGIKKIIFKNKNHTEVFGDMMEKNNSVTFFKIEDNVYGSNLFSKYNHEALREYIMNGNKNNRRDVRNIILQKDHAYSFSLVEKFNGQRYSDGYDDIPVDGWWIEILDSSNQKFEIQINFQYNT